MATTGVKTRSAPRGAIPLQTQVAPDGPEDFAAEDSLEEPPRIVDASSDEGESDFEQDDEVGEGDDADEELAEDPSSAPPSPSAEQEEDEEEEAPPTYKPEDYEDFNENCFEGWKKKERATYSPPGPTPQEHVRIPGAAAKSRLQAR